ncbi:Ku protein [Niabella yanshanensis]|uniref:Non-homologous end joining protein Ku n=1 Tax=Niabella yanshanensis TaxID=577386 RepID=A0ABZ0W749_9BACT|nr:Ku protein [Niabella yanshanensis]WQD37352.1 Ku protein [Niabella yanshanensis]
MKAIWTGAIGFGLVNIPVKLYSATEESSLDLDMLDKKDHSHIKYKRVNEKTGKEVAWENIVKGYDYDGKYIVLDEKDFEKAMPEKTKILSIDHFVQEDEIDSIYFETPYFLEPQKNGEAPYTLLVEALKKTKMAGVGTFVMRNKEVLGILRPYDNIILFQRIRYDQEIRKTADLSVPKKSVKPAELKMAVTLIEQLSEKFDISAYKNTYSEKLMKVIEAKAKGKKVTAPKLRVAHVKTKDLMEQLKASLSAKKKAS